MRPTLVLNPSDDDAFREHALLTLAEWMAPEEFEARLRRQLLREKLDQNVKVNEAFETGALPTIHVSLGALQASRPAPQYEHASGD